MAIKQLSVLAENKKGSLKRIIDLLSEAGLDLRSICIADTEDYGILRIIADDTKKAEQILTENGFTARATEVAAVAIPDRPGGLSGVLEILDRENINIEYMYSVISSHANEAYMVLRGNDNEKTEKALKSAGIKVLGEKDI